MAGLTASKLAASIVAITSPIHHPPLSLLSTSFANQFIFRKHNGLGALINVLDFQVKRRSYNVRI
jgi:hypothetical protein